MRTVILQELRKALSEMSDRYDKKVRGILGIGTRDVREMEILVKNLRWTEEGLERVASDGHRQALPEGLGLSKESKTVTSAAVKPVRVDKKTTKKCWRTVEDEVLEPLNYMHLDRSDVQHAAKEMCTKMANSTRGSRNRLKKECRYSSEVEK